jgi:hypothetical protein
MTKLSEGNSNGAGPLSDHVDSTCLSFSRRGHHILYSIAHDMDGCIVHGSRMSCWIVAEDKPGSSAGASFWENKGILHQLLIGKSY